jgi:hypothetical protein
MIATSNSFVSQDVINDQFTSLLKHNHPAGRLVTNLPSSLCITSYIDVQNEMKNQP